MSYIDIDIAEENTHFQSKILSCRRVETKTSLRNVWNYSLNYVMTKKRRLER